eukprot:TRINITY_DN717_c2_g2_i1.p1 TRINITY_DN717_c2_g2~~TRINITY_DN717_c2_g2_i1.p1  ORF type:complete len:249 (-),score=38.55 TRINITY_DN717_c2_g2_i1:70-816(-)
MSTPPRVRSTSPRSDLVVAGGMCATDQCVVAHNLVHCKEMNGVSVCADKDALWELDAQVGEAAGVFLDLVGPTCRDSIESHLCALAFPECDHDNDSGDATTTPIKKECFDTCVDAYTTCGVKPRTSEDICSVSASSPYATIARRVGVPVPSTEKSNPSQCLSIDGVGKSQGRCVVAQEKDLSMCGAMSGKKVFLHERSFTSVRHADDFVHMSVRRALDNLPPSATSSSCKDTITVMLCAQNLPEWYVL